MVFPFEKNKFYVATGHPEGNMKKNVQKHRFYDNFEYQKGSGHG